jgi:hypothetical protein
MEKYINEIQPLSQMADKVGGKINRSMNKRIIPRLNKAGKEFLERIRSECNLGATKEELEEEQNLLRPSVVEKPELTFEYLKSIGREDMTCW